MKIYVVDYGVGNIFNVVKAFERIGTKVELATTHKDIQSADKLILPGVGAFSEGMKNLTKNGLHESILDFNKSGKPLLGICLGMQMLLDFSSENGRHKGLGLIPGEVVKFDGTDKTIKIPHMSWNKVTVNKIPNFEVIKKEISEIERNPYFYFVHSYYASTDESNIFLKCHYANKNFAAAVQKDNIFGYQFHPERSGEMGLKLLNMFVKI